MRQKDAGEAEKSEGDGGQREFAVVVQWKRVRERLQARESQI